jgi:hypothetical protein
MKPPLQCELQGILLFISLMIFYTRQTEHFPNQNCPYFYKDSKSWHSLSTSSRLVCPGDWVSWAITLPSLLGGAGSLRSSFPIGNSSKAFCSHLAECFAVELATLWAGSAFWAWGDLAGASKFGGMVGLLSLLPRPASSKQTLESSWAFPKFSAWFSTVSVHWSISLIVKVRVSVRRSNLVGYCFDLRIYIRLLRASHNET